MLPLVSMSNGEAGANVYVSGSESASVAATVPTAVPAALFSVTSSVEGADAGKNGFPATAALVVPLPEADHGPAPSPFARTCTRYAVDASSPVSVAGLVEPTSATSVHCVSDAGSDVPA